MCGPCMGCAILFGLRAFLPSSGLGEGGRFSMLDTVTRATLLCFFWDTAS